MGTTHIGSALLVAAMALALGILTSGSAVGEAPATHLAEDGRPKVTFTGFHVYDGGRSRIFVKLTGDVDVEANPAGKKPTFVLRGAKIGVRNNKNPLLTQHFASSVMSARLVPSADAVTLSIVLRDAVTPSHRVVRHQDGSVTVNFDFPAASPKSNENENGS